MGSRSYDSHNVLFRIVIYTIIFLIMPDFSYEEEKSNTTLKSKAKKTSSYVDTNFTTLNQKKKSVKTTTSSFVNLNHTTPQSNGEKVETTSGFSNLNLSTLQSTTGELTTSTRFPKFLRAPAIVKALEPHTATIIFLHDHAENGHWWAKHMEPIRQPYMKLVCPTADRMVTIFDANEREMTAWFDFDGETIPIIRQCIEFQIDKSTDYVHQLIDREIKDGIKSERIIIGGTAMGGQLAIHSALSYPKRLGAIFAFSPWDMIGKTFNQTFQEVNRDIPVFHSYVTGNPYTAKKNQLETLSHLMTNFTRNIQFKTYDVNHTTAHEEFIDAGRFCKKHVGPYFN